ncbi:PREDICTED: uncharacterized protein LOC105451282 [Wasmannia auropunctata]|uniref:uncharacterized protein LOC105451282 n=1 Tax=Wasmannia auropunctata TaxID=64793 RepID=UPI0005EF68F5|nr:PREDICTED: uncharacterized protein LOC105451282 [Wasmannia auropunctata]
MFDHRNLAAILKSPVIDSDKNEIGDITDGSEYVRVNSRINRGQYDLTLVLNTDGLSLVNSSKSYCWPLIFVIAELPEYLRMSFMVMIGLWYDDTCKPLMNVFLQPFCSKLRNCFYNGICWTYPETNEQIISKIVAPLIIADAPARVQIQNILSFNGKYGCNICEIKMKKCKKISGQRSYRIYPFKKEDSTLRNDYRMRKQANKASHDNLLICFLIKKGYGV